MPANGRVTAVLFDRDGTLVVDSAIGGNAWAVQPAPFARESMQRLRKAGIRLGVISNQPGVADGQFSLKQLARVNARIDRMLGRFDVWCCCTHSEGAGCTCRKPRPGLVYQAAATLAVSPAECVVVGDIGADVDAALAAGAWPILVPTLATLRPEIERAPTVASDLRAAVDLILSGLV